MYYLTPCPTDAVASWKNIGNQLLRIASRRTSSVIKRSTLDGNVIVIYWGHANNTLLR